MGIRDVSMAVCTVQCLPECPASWRDDTKDQIAPFPGIALL